MYSISKLADVGFHLPRLVLANKQAKLALGMLLRERKG
jgi:hypothetical protein